MSMFLQGYLWCIGIISYPIALLITTLSFFKDGLAQHMLIFSSVVTVVTLVGLILFCLLARWYKRRERDDIVNVHTSVEDVYDRYLK